MNLNAATPKDVYPMPVADMLVDAVAGHELLSFMDGTAGYHQIPVYEPDRHKTAFRCPGFTGVFEYNNMSFGLTNARATYQRAMNLIFHDVLGGILEVYIDDVVVKSKKKEDHIEHLRTVFSRMRKHKLRMNPAKCIFGVRAGDFLGFIVHERGIEVAEDKSKAVLDMPAPRNKKELHSLLGKINFIRRFISNSAGKTAVFSPLMKLKTDQEFQWGPAQQEAFDKIKEYLTHPPVLRPPRPGIPITDHLSGAGVALVNPSGVRHCYSFQLEWKCTNNQAEYEAIIIGLELLLDLEVTEVEVLDVVLDYIPRERNFAANELAQLATCIRLADGVRERILKVQRRTLPSFMARKEVNDDWLVAVLDTIDVDWRQPISQYLTDPSAPVDKRVRYFATNYVLRGGELLRRAEEGLYLRCIYGAEAKRCLREVHCDCISFAQGCIECQMHGPVQHVPDVPLQPIIKPWPGRGWDLDFIGGIHPNSSLQHKHILLATNFFTKYGIPECLVADRGGGAGFRTDKTQKFLAVYGIKFLHSSPYYAQSNGQAKASNRVIMSILKRMLDTNPRSWHTELDHILWAYRTSKRTPTGTTPYALMYGHDAVLPIEVNVQSLRVREQHQLIGEDYVQAMYQEHEDLDSRRMEALDSLMAEKQKIARLYDKRTRGRSFGVGDLVWKACLPYGERVDGHGKWSAKWEGPFVIDRVMDKGAYYLRDTDGNVHRNLMNGCHLKKYFPSVWEYEDPPAAVQSQ
ncbi:uncharacterized protein LOC126796823 [Argentina anserina]|uniref:uncharacterized protein LOC126796823 n=1 Tax=Argentina anserina TaxID=57926 RepID=UPI0021764739|nr:uncharacterized protein LOC126796823 [Potentilla anserina]